MTGANHAAQTGSPGCNATVLSQHASVPRLFPFLNREVWQNIYEMQATLRRILKLMREQAPASDQSIHSLLLR